MPACASPSPTSSESPWSENRSSIRRFLSRGRFCQNGARISWRLAIIKEEGFYAGKLPPRAGTSARHRPCVSGDAGPFPQRGRLPRTTRPRIRRRRPPLRQGRDAPGREEARAQGTPGAQHPQAAGAHAAAGDCRRPGGPLLHHRAPGRRQGADPRPKRPAPGGAGVRRSGGALERRVAADPLPGVAGRRPGQVRLHLVHPRHRQVPQAAGRGAAGVLRAADLRAADAAVLPGGDGQGAGAPGPVHPGRDRPGPAGDHALRVAALGPAQLCVRPHRQPHRRGAGLPAVPPPGDAAAGLLPGSPGGRLGGAGTGAGEHPQLPHRQRHHVDPRCAVLGGVHRGDVLLQRLADAGGGAVAAAVLPHLPVHHTAAAGAAERELHARGGEPGLPGGDRQRHRHPQGDGGGAADQPQVGQPTGRLRGGQLPHPDAVHPGQRERRPGGQAGDGGDPVAGRAW